jgi:uncharacterized protein (TIGR00369 family)
MKAISELTPKELNQLNHNTLMESLGIEFLITEPEYVKARMPVDRRTIQPAANILHGGASLALAETVGSLGSMLITDMEQFDVRGAALSANHVRPAKDGWVYAEARLVHRGRNTHLWNIEIRNEAGELVSTARLTNFIVPRQEA